MNIQELERKAEEVAISFMEGYRECSKMDLICEAFKEGAHWAITEGGRGQFAEGARWAIESAWHDASVKPEYNSPILIRLSDPKRPGIYTGKFEHRPKDGDTWSIDGYFTPAKPEYVEGWAYISDLLPERIEETE